MNKQVIILGLFILALVGYLLGSTTSSQSKIGVINDLGLCKGRISLLTVYLSKFELAQKDLLGSDAKIIQGGGENLVTYRLDSRGYLSKMPVCKTGSMPNSYFVQKNIDGSFRIECSKHGSMHEINVKMAKYKKELGL
ncbi:hypothetical protein KAJ27_00135 [bacterium]|nr:hypothetical protein [bacterium]